MKIMIVTSYDVETTRNWSGTPYFVVKQIRSISDDVVVYRPQSLSWYRIFSKLIRRAAILLGNSSIDFTRTSYYSRKIAKEVELEIARNRPDVIVGIAASIELAYVKSEQPIIHLSDATFCAMLDYYPEFTGLWNWLKKQGNEIEQRIIDSADAIICSSSWAKSSLINDYCASPEKIHTILLGANIVSRPNITKQDIEKKFNGKCKLLFIGKDWDRKGGDIVLEAYKRLIEYGVDAELTIIGSKNSSIPNQPTVNVYENLNKNSEKDLALFNSIFIEASFFILPTKAEAYGLVYAEAAAFGTPALGVRTGGVPSVVEDNITGALLPKNASADQYAERIIEMWNDKEALKKMSIAASHKFARDLNWNRWTEDFVVVMESLLRK